MIIGFSLSAVYSINTILSSLLPAVDSTMNLSPFVAGVVISAYGWIYAMMQIPVGITSDRYDPRKVMSLSMFGFFVSGIAFSISRNETELVLSRLFMGIAASFVFVDGLKSIEYFYDMSERGRAVAIFLSIGSVGIALPNLAVSLLPAGTVSSWRTIYIAVNILAFLASIFSATFLPRKLLDRDRHVGNDWGKSKVLRSRFLTMATSQFAAQNVIDFAYFGTFIGVLFWLPTFVVAHYSSFFLGGVSVALLGGGSIAGSLTTGWLVDFFKSKKSILIIFMTVYLLSLLSIAFSSSPVVTILSSLLFGFTNGGFVAFTRLVGERTQKNNIGIAFGVINTTSWLGSAFYSFLIGLLLSFGIGFTWIFFIVSLSISVPIILAKFIVVESSKK
ncbi:MAG: MFS transporter [Rhabdochlamydiaceae bacterium]